MNDAKRYKEKNRKLAEWKRKLSLILEYSGKISTSSGLSDILKVITNETRDVILADRCTVFLLDKSKNELYSWIAHGLGRKKIRFPASTGLAGAAVTTGKIINVKDAYSDRRFNPEIDQKTGYYTKSILCVPMRNQPGQIIGVFQVLNKKDGFFTKQDEEMLRLLSSQASGIIENAMLYEEMKKSFKSFINTLAETVDARDPLTAGHSSRVCAYSLLIADRMGYSDKDRERLQYAALLHDLGKIGVKEAVLTKPGRLDLDESAHIQTHTSVTRKILERTYFQHGFRNIPIIASSHHENVDGTGYPQKLKGEEIPEISRIMAVADVFDALTYKRHYRNPMPMEKVLSILREETGRKFDPGCIDAFFSLDLCDVLRVMTEAEENGEKDSIGSGMSEFRGISLKDLHERLKKKEKDEAVKKFSKFYPVAGLKKRS